MISIIIPTYNRSEYLVYAIESCLQQTYSDVEIIIVDDGSTDNTEQRVAELLQNDWKEKNIIYIQQLNSGASSARNHGLKLAKGEFIQFLDSDDLLFESKLELQLKKLNETNADGCSCFGLMGSNLSSSKIIGESFDSKLDLLHRMCSGNVHVMQTSAPLWRKSFIERTSSWNTKLAFGDDLEFHICVLLATNKIAFIPEKLFFVRDHNDYRLSNASGNIKQIESGIKTQQLIAEAIKKNGLWDKEFQQGILKNARTLYASYMKLSDENNLRLFEQWLIEIAKSPVISYKILALIYFRKYVGAKFILSIFNFKKNILHR